MKRLAAFTVLILAGSSLPALAAATAEGASQLTQDLQAYFGSEPGVVTVTVDGDAYAARIDFAPHFAKIKDPKVSASLTPIELKLTDQGGGKWQVDQDQPLSFAFKVDGAIDMKGSVGSLKSTGVFDEALGSFTAQTADVGQIAFQQQVIEAGKPSDVTYTFASIHSEIAMTGSGDNATGTQKYTFKDMRETMDMPGAPDGSMPPMQVSISSPEGVQDISVTGFKPKAISALAAWLVAHPSKDAIVAAQAELKDKLRGALPLWNSLSATSTLNALSINTLIGQFSTDRAEVKVEANGIVADGKLREAFTVTGLKLPEGIVPPFAANLVPHNFTLDFNLSDFNLEAPARLALDNFDLAKDPPLPPGMEQQLLGALMPKMAVTVGLGPSEFVASAFHLKAEGNLSAGPVAMPAGSALVQLKGIDDIMSALQAAPPEMGMAQMAPMIIVAKGLAKPEADGFLSWKIESTPQGSVTINGTDVSKIGGGQ